MGSRDPYSYLFSRAGIGKPDDAERPDPWNFLFEKGIQPSELATNTTTGVERFGEGIGRGMFYPVRSLMKPAEEPTESPGIAGMVGEFVGMGVAFVPFFKGAQAVTTGVGFLRNLPRIAKLSEGAISFAAFEALAGKTPTEGVRDVPKNLLIGAAFEGAVMAGVGAWRGRFPRHIEDTPLLKPGTGAAVPEVAVHPDALKMERWFAPADETPEVTFEKLAAVKDPAANLYQAMVRITTQHMPGGQLILPGVKDVKGIGKVADELGLQTGYHISDTKNGFFDVLVVDPNRSILRIKDKALAKKFLGEGEPVLTYEEAIKLIDDSGELRPIERLPEGIPGGAIGDFTTPGFMEGSKGRIRMDEGHPVAIKFSILIHEYMHFVHFKTTGNRHIQVGTLDEVFKITNQDSNIAAIENIRAELFEASVQTIQRSQPGYLRTRQAALSIINNDPGYFRQDTEMMSRLAELMFLDPKKAREAAPRATRMMAKLFVRKSPIMRELMTKEQKRIDDIFTELWVRRGDETTVWQTGAARVGQKELRQYSKTGFFPGMQVYAEGQEAAFVKRAGDAVTVKLARSGKEMTLPFNKIQSASVPTVLTHIADVTKAVDEVIEKQLMGGQLKWVAANLRKGDEIHRSVIVLDEYETTTSLRKWLKGLSDEERKRYLEYSNQAHGYLPPPGPADTIVAEILSRRGKKGLAIVDNGEVELIVADNNSILVSERASLGLEGAVDGDFPYKLIGGRIKPSLDNTLRSMLREQGVLEPDLPYFLNLTKDRYKEKLRGLADTTTKQITENVETQLAAGQTTASRGMRLGDIEKDGAHFSEEGNFAGYGDEGNPATRRYDYSKAKLADPDSPTDFRAVIEQARKDAPKWVKPGQLDEYLRSLDDVEPGYWDYTQVEELHLDDAAKKLGYDGIRKWEQGDINRPTTVNIWNLDKVDEIGAHADVIRSLSNDGLIELRQASTNSVLGRFSNESKAASFILRSGMDDGVPPLMDHPSGVAAGGSGSPPRPQAQFGSGGDGFGPPPPPSVAGKVPSPRGNGRSGKFVDAMSLFGTMFTAMENVAKAAENRGIGPAFTRVFDPAQRAIIEVDRQLSDVKRKLLGGVSFSEGMQGLEKSLRGVNKERQTTVTQYVEALSREEIAAPGGLLQRGMTENEVRVAKELVKAGLHNDLPRLMTTERLIASALKGRQKLENTIIRMRQTQLSPEKQQLVALFEAMPKFKSREEVLQFLGATEEEKWALRLIRDSMTADKDKFSVFAVSRYAAAQPLKKGFKTMREQFAIEQKLTANEMKAAEQIDKMLEAAFEISGIEAKRSIGGYWPHMRMWAQYGWNPKDVGKFAGLPKEFIDWSHDRFRTGELDIYNMDPLITTFKYVRGLLMKQNFDPILPDISQAIKLIKSSDPRIARVMGEYIEELKGKPHASFTQLETAIGSGLRALTGNEVKPGLVSQVVNSFAALAASAAIPFRPALIIRNYAESVLKIAPRTGMKHYLKALSYVVSPSTKGEAFELAKRGRAISVGPQAIRSIHASDDIFGPQMGKGMYRMERMLEAGFKWYQSADDLGRSIAFHAQRMRMADHYSDYVRGKLSIDEYLEKSKILTFDPIDVAEAERLIKAGNLEGAQDYLGRTLARETMNRYGHANHPSGWNSVAGRLFGQFGTWPVQYKDYLSQGLSRGTTKDKVEFAMTHGAVSGSFVLGGQAVGLNLMSWVGFPSLTYTGGPFTDLTIDVARSINGSDTEKALARHNLYAQIPILGWIETGRPNSIFLPGSYLLGDIMSAINNEESLFGSVELGSMAEGIGFNVIRSEEKTAFEWFMEQ